MKNENGDYALSIQAYSLRPGASANEPEDISSMQNFPSLKEAFETLQKYDNRSYDKQLADEAGLDKYIQMAASLNCRLDHVQIRSRGQGSAKRAEVGRCPYPVKNREAIGQNRRTEGS